MPFFPRLSTARRRRRRSRDTSWRAIDQRAKGTELAKTHLRRTIKRTLRVSAALGAVVLVVWGVSLGYRETRAFIAEMEELGLSNPVRQLRVDSNGVLDEQWFREYVGMTPSGVLGVNIREIKERLEAHGQVRRATVTRTAPDALEIDLVEREPLLRAMIAGENGRPFMLLVARDGAVYEGAGYAPASLDHLPYLRTSRLVQRRDGSFAPVSGMHIVDELMMTARLNYPALYSDFRIVRGKYIDEGQDSPGAYVSVISRSNGEFIFATYDFGSQLERLERVLAAMPPVPGRRELARIDLRQDDVPVRFADAVSSNGIRN